MLEGATAAEPGGAQGLSSEYRCHFLQAGYALELLDLADERGSRHSVLY